MVVKTDYPGGIKKKKQKSESAATVYYKIKNFF